MLAVMLDAALISVLLGLAALLLDRVLADCRRPRRFVWLAALIASLALPILAALAPATALEFLQPRVLPQTLAVVRDILPERFGGALGEASAVREGGAHRDGGAPSTGHGLRGSASVGSGFGATWLPTRRLDLLLLVIWIMSSSLLLAMLALSWHGLRRALRKARTATVAGTEVYCLDAIGPAVVGFRRPCIVLPSWLLDGPQELQALVLRHEREHIAAHDHLLSLLALLLVSLMPFNPVIWWQFRRLRAAVEHDCDTRVLVHGVDVFSYSEALLAVRRKLAATPLSALAMIEPASELERRIETMTAKTRRVGIPQLGLRVLIALALAGLALSVSAPQAQQAAADDELVLIVRVLPAFPVKAMLDGIAAGEVAVEYTVDARGTVRDVSVVESSAPVFDEAAVQAAEKYKYRPGVEDGEPVVVSGIGANVVFELDRERMTPNELALYQAVFGDAADAESVAPLASRSAEERAEILSHYAAVLEDQILDAERSMRDIGQSLDSALQLIKDSDLVDADGNLRDRGDDPPE
jgi:TonB family protein